MQHLQLAKATTAAAFFLLALACTDEKAPASPVASTTFQNQPTALDPAKQQAKESPTRKAPVCDSAARKCQGLTVTLTCAADGAAWVDTACDPGSVCEDGQCRVKVCAPNAKTCDGNEVATCSARGTSITQRQPCASDESCVGGVCQPQVCAPGQVKCSGHAVATCKPDGLGWGAKSCTADQSCDPNGAGKGKALCREQICPMGELWCQNGKAMACDDLGVSQELADDCAAKGKACVDGACVPFQCAPGGITCDGKGLSVCSADGMAATKKGCATGSACLAGSDGKASCAPVVCVAGETFCDAQDVATCDGNGVAFTVKQTCPDKDAQGIKVQCKQGACKSIAAVCGDGLCDAGEQAGGNQPCAKDCKPITLVAPDFDQLPPTLATTLPRAPRTMTKSLQPAWLGGKAMALHGLKLFVVDTDNGALVRMDRKTLTIEATIAVGGRPEHVVVGPDGAAYVPSRDAGTVARIPWLADKVESTWNVGTSGSNSEPWGVALSFDAKKLFVTLTGENAVVALDTTTGKETARAQTASRPKTMLLAAHPTSPRLWVLHGTGTVSHIEVGALKPKLAGVALPNMAEVGLRTNDPVPACQGEITKKARIANRATGLCIEPETGNVLVSHVLVNSGSAQEVLLSVGIKPPEKPQEFVVKCTGGYGSTCSKLPVPPPPGEPPCVGVPVRPYEPTVSEIGPFGTLQPTVADNAVKDEASGRYWLARFDQPADVTMHPTLSLAFVVARGTNNVLVLNTAAKDPMQWPLADIKVGEGPEAVVVAPDGQTMYTYDATGFTVSEIDLAPLTQAAATALTIETDPAKLPKVAPLYMVAAKSAPYGKDPLSAKAQLGRKVFHYANNARLSVSNRFACATCHLDGTEDKQVWFIAEGPRQTPALAERLADTAPYNWLGTKYTLHENIISTTARMGGAGLLPAELEGLVQFLLTGLKAPPNPHVDPVGLTPQQAAGKAIFESAEAQCATCHVPGSLTDGAQHDVGTATDTEIKVAQATNKPTKLVYNTPSLRGLFYSAPYLHDGSATTLKQALQKTSNTMGKTSHLSDKQLDDLVAYLLTL